MNELSAAAEEVTGKINQVLAQGDKEPVVTDEKLRQPQLEEGQATQADGVAEVILRNIDPGDLARYQAQIAEAKATEPPLRKSRRQSRRTSAAVAIRFTSSTQRSLWVRVVHECDRLVARQLMSELLAERSGRRLSDDEIAKVGSILLQGPVAQELKQTQGKEAGVKYAIEVLTKAQQVVEKAQQANQAQRRRRDQGMER